MTLIIDFNLEKRILMVLIIGFIFLKLISSGTKFIKLKIGGLNFKCKKSIRT